MRRFASRSIYTLVLAGTPVFATSAAAQLGRQQGLVEPNVAAETTLAKLPGMTPAVAQTVRAARPILSVTALDSILGANNVGRPQRTTLYGRMFVHVDVNRGTDAEFMLIPGVNAARLTAIKAGRPWKTFEQFQAEMGKTANATEVARLEQYLFIPIELNTFTPAIMDTFLSIGVGTAQWKKEFDEYRPWTSMEQFDRQIGKYLRANPAELQRLKRYVIIAK